MRSQTEDPFDRDAQTEIQSIILLLGDITCVENVEQEIALIGLRSAIAISRTRQRDGI